MTNKEFEKRIVDAGIIALIRSGDINPRGKDRLGLLRAAGRRLKKGKIQWQMIVDHQTALRERAEGIINERFSQTPIFEPNLFWSISSAEGVYPKTNMIAPAW